jgi:hypothetical protein
MSRIVKKPSRKFITHAILIAFAGLTLAACSGAGSEREDVPQFPMDPEDRRNLRNGRLTGEDGWNIFGGDDSTEDGGASPIGVNSFLWQATLDTLTFMPITSADPFGGVVLTDWYESPKARGERFKVTALILGRSLRTDAIKVTVHKQQQDDSGQWRDMPVNDDLARKLEDTILTQARELRVQSGG